jgi:hypothetical protein
MLFSKPFIKHNAHMDRAKRIRTLIPDIVRETHRTISTLIAQLSPCVQECLRAGLPIQTIEDALGTPAPRRAGLENLESLPQRVVAITQDVEALKARIADQALL